ncbi:MAG: peptide-binding protein [Deltaproteobacteria bacterium]|nr:peptide-binding protein [Deltaproteobacteria bacterium]MBI4795514.1 peptide-binding protein [Deltaproteobacteria bacterium]
MCWLFFFLGVALLTGAGCGSPEAEKVYGGPDTGPAYGDLFIDASIGDASTLIPPLASDAASHAIASLVYNGMVKYDGDLTLIGDLAESWEVSPDGLTITFKLRRGVKWQDGAPFTAQDVLFTYRVMVDPKTPTAYSGDYLQVKKAEAVDDYTFRVTYPQPFAPALGTWTLNILPRHLLEGQDITKSPLARHPIGTGPYRFQEWKAGEKIALVYNPDYFEGRVYLNGYIYLIKPDLATMFLELKAGNIDRMGLEPLQYARQTEYPKFARMYNKYRYIPFSYIYLGYNLEDTRFKDRRVRQALTLAINKKEIIEGVLMGLGQESFGPYKPGAWFYNPDVPKFSYDPAKARALLAAAGWQPGADGILTKDGKPFEFTILTNQGNTLRQRTAEIIQRRLQEIGIRVQIRTVEWATFIKQFIEKGHFEAVLLGWNTGLDPDQYDIWHSSKTRPGELNFIHYKNPEVDKLLEEGRHTFDKEKRRRAYFRLQEILAEDQPYTFLFVPDALPAISRRFRGIKPAAAGIDYNFIKWYVPKAEQKYTLSPY